MIVLDSSVLSPAFRRDWRGGLPPRQVIAFHEILRSGEPVVLPGIVVQEVLTGLRSKKQFLGLDRDLRELRHRLDLATRALHVMAAEIATACARKGFIESATDCLVAATAIARAAPLLHNDKHFREIAQCSALKLHPASGPDTK